MKKLIAKWSHILALLILPCSLLTAQTFTIKATDSCGKGRVSVGYTINLPGPLISSGVTSETGDITWTIQSSDPAGTYTISLEGGIGATPNAFFMTKGGASVNAFFSVSHPGKPDFSIDGVQAGNPPFGTAIPIYKCGLSNAVPVANMSIRPSYIGAYRFTIYNSTIAGAVGTQVSQTAWLTLFPSAINMPSATGQYYIVRLEVQNNCKSASTAVKDALVLWNTGIAPNNFQVNRSAVNCLTSSSVSNNGFDPVNGTLMRPLLGGTVTKSGTSFTQNRVEIHEVNSSGTVIGLGLVADRTFVNGTGEDISARNFIEIFDGLPIWASGFGSPWTNANSSKRWRMSLYLYSPACGWTSPLIHYFRINTACPSALSLDGPGDEESSARDVSDHQGRASSTPVAVAWPNPVSGMLHISLTGIENGEFHIDLFDMAGRRMPLSFDPVANGGTVTLDVSALPRGTYSYRVVVSGEGHSGRFVKI